MAVREIGRNDEWRDVASVPRPNAEPSLVLELRQRLLRLLPAPSLKRAPYSRGKRRPLPTSAPTASTAAGNQSIMKQCGAQWQAAKASGTTGSTTWPQFLKSCRAQLASTTSAPPQGGFAPATPAPAPTSAPTQSGSLFPWQRPAAPPAGSTTSTEGGFASAQEAQIAVPDQLSFGSMSIRTSTISLEHAITATRKAELICARRRLRLQVIAQR
jgi:hypothetical protein